jgi:hypothetical protein
MYNELVRIRWYALEVVLMNDGKTETGQRKRNKKLGNGRKVSLQSGWEGGRQKEK